MDTQSITQTVNKYSSPLRDCRVPGTMTGILGGTPSGIFIGREVTGCFKTCDCTLGLCAPPDITYPPCSIQMKGCCACTGITVGTAMAGCCLCFVLLTAVNYARSSKETKKMFCEELSSPRVLLHNLFTCGRSQAPGKQIPQQTTKNQSVDLSEGAVPLCDATEALTTCITSQPLPSAKSPEAVTLIQPFT